MTEELNAENTERAKPDEPQNKKSNFKVFAWGFITCLVIGMVFVGIFKYKTYQEEKRFAEERRKYELEHATVVRDSLAKVAILEAAHKKMKYEIHRFDSARAKLRYKIGDIVYLKPDSTIGVVSDITADSSLCCFTYILSIGNKDGASIICERKEKMVY